MAGVGLCIRYCTVKMKVLYQHLLWCQVCANVTPGVLLTPQGVTPAH